MLELNYMISIANSKYVIDKESIEGFELAKQLEGEFGQVIGFESKEDESELFDLHCTITGSNLLTPITPSHTQYLTFLRHDCEHVLAQAVLELFPHTKLATGANNAHGFGYDFCTQEPFTLADLAIIKQKMQEIIARKHDILRENWDINDAITYYKQIENTMKVEVLETLQKRNVREVGMYFHGEEGEFIDLCNGPHGTNLAQIPIDGFELTQLSAAQWVCNDGSIVPTQRIKGVLFANATELANYLHAQEQAKELDHRKLAQKMDLFHIAEHSPGFPFWHPNGYASIKALKEYITNMLGDDYMEVHTPGLINSDLWKRSGHWDKFHANMFCVQEKEGENVMEYALKPMNCPAHVEIFNSHFLGGVISYTHLPLRISEFGEVYRKEPTGGLQGLKRVRTFTQDDGHIFCTHEQIESEVVKYCDLFRKVYAEFGFKKYQVDLSTRPQARIGSNELWDQAEQALRQGALVAGFEFSTDEGGGAFYGPKLDFHVWDSLERKWQCSTVQLDFNLPGRLGAQYIDKEGQKQTPVMIHRAIYGSIERFLALALENNAGWLPVWAAGVQAVIVPLCDQAEQVCADLYALLRPGRVKIDNRRESLGYKVREHTIKRVSHMILVGKKEIEIGQITIKNLHTGQELRFEQKEGVAYLQNLMKVPVA